MGNITNPKFISVSETAKLLNKKEVDILTLCNRGIIERTSKDNSILVYKDSVESYAKTNNIDLNSDKRLSFRKDFTVEESMSMLKTHREEELHKLVQNGKLQQKMEVGKIKIVGSSLATYLNNLDFQAERKKEGFR